MVRMNAGTRLESKKGMGNMAEELVVSDVMQQLKDEIRRLKTTLSELLQERDDLLYHICPKLRAAYAKEIGDYQIRANRLELTILELKRRIEITRAALNREKSISEEEVDEQVDREYQDFHEQVDREYRKSKRYQEEQARKEERSKAYREQWEKQHRHNEDQHQQNGDQERQSEDQRRQNGGQERQSEDQNAGEKDDFSKKQAPPSAKELYRKIVKRLHPDMNPNATERELELFRRAAIAYEDGDIETLQQIYDEVFGLDAEESSGPVTLEELTAQRERLTEQIAAVTEEIYGIRHEFPYTQKEFLEDMDAVREKQEAILQLIREYEAEIERLQKLLEDVNREMEELKNRKNG